MDRQPRSTISKEHAQREAQRAKKLSLNPSKAEVAALWERPIYHGPSALRNWVPSFVRVCTSGTADATFKGRLFKKLIDRSDRNMALPRT